MRAVVEEVVKCTAAHCGVPLLELPHQQIFDQVTISIFYNKDLCIWQQLLTHNGQ